MTGLFKWIWARAEQHGRERASFEISSALQYHQQKQEAAYLKEKYEKPRKDDDIDDLLRHVIRPNLTAKEHSIVADELSHLIDRIAPTEPTPMYAEELDTTSSQ